MHRSAHFVPTRQPIPDIRFINIELRQLKTSVGTSAAAHGIRLQLVERGQDSFVKAFAMAIRDPAPASIKATTGAWPREVAIPFSPW